MFSLDDMQSQAKNMASSPKRYYKTSFMQGSLSNILNPKTVLVYVTIMPQFINLNGNINQQLIILASILTLLAVLWFLFLVYIIDYAKMDENFEVQKVFQKITGIILVGFGIKTGLS